MRMKIQNIKCCIAVMVIMMMGAKVFYSEDDQPHARNRRESRISGVKKRFCEDWYPYFNTPVGCPKLDEKFDHLRCSSVFKPPDNQAWCTNFDVADSNSFSGPCIVNCNARRCSVKWRKLNDGDKYVTNSLTRFNDNTAKFPIYDKGGVRYVRKQKPNKKTSGDRYGMGKHMAQFQAVDNSYNRNKKSCQRDFIVQVNSCPRPNDPDYGSIQCEYELGNDAHVPHRPISNETCTVTCNMGYHIAETANSETTIQCIAPYDLSVTTANNNDGTWSVNDVLCQPIQCQPPMEDHASCNEGLASYNYDDECTLACDAEFAFEGESDTLICKGPNYWETRNENADWPICIDETGPDMVYCPNDIVAFADIGTLTKQITWLRPQYHDTVDGTIEPQLVDGDPQPGSLFTYGNPVTITYEAEDNSRNLAEMCVFSVTLEVLQCGDPTRPHLQMTECDLELTIGIIYGDQCTFECDEGYVVNNTQAICTSHTQNPSSESDMIWHPYPTCAVITCEAPDNLAHASCASEVRVHEYDDACIVQCHAGYFLREGVSPSLICKGNQESSWWETIGNASWPTCSDIIGPIMSNCPNDIVAIADSGSLSTPVTWYAPQCNDAIDGHIEPVLDLHSPQPGSAFSNESTVQITYYCLDSAGNPGELCQFLITVTVLTCTLPAVEHLQLIGCSPEFLNINTIYGAQCSFTCSSGYEVSASQASCISREATPSEDEQLEWSSSLTCEESQCQPLIQPINGYATCPQVTPAFRRCFMVCYDGYEIAFTSDPSTIYMCYLNEGIWWNDGRMMDAYSPCTPDTSASGAQTNIEIIFEIEDCTGAYSQVILEQLRQWMINETQSSSYYDYACDDADDCGIGSNIEVFCDDSTETNRRRRHATTGGIRLELFINISFNSSEPVETRRAILSSDINNAIEELVEHISNESPISSTSFVVTDTAYDTDSLLLTCPSGTVSVISTFSCASCEPGKYLSDETCEPCAIGKYNEQSAQVECVRCPIGYSTKEVGTMLASSCIELCSTGFYSIDGMLPCQQCSYGKYSSAMGSTVCQQCPEGTSTTVTGSRGIDACHPVGPCMLHPCFTGSTCVPDGFNFICHCPSGFTGQLCESELEACDNNVCAHGGSCFVGIGNFPFSYSCTCLPDHTGHFCNYQIVNGGWSEYGEWTACIPITNGCGAGNKRRMRVCNNPRPNAYGIDCIGSYNDTEECMSEQPCQNRPCTPNVCMNGGTCVPSGASFTCVCRRRFTGELCETEKDPCENNVCANGGSCYRDETNSSSLYRCACSESYTGFVCQNLIVNGGWSAFSPWSPCTAYEHGCGLGYKTRYRICNNPIPNSYGMRCSGTNSETEECNSEEQCLVCPDPPAAPIGAVFSCYIGEGRNGTCELSCTDNKRATKIGVNIIKCNEGTGNEWTPAITTDEFPKCTDAEIPDEFSTKHYMMFPDGPTDTEALENELSNAIGSVPSSDCIEAGSCSIAVSTNQESSRRKKKSTDVDMIITITAYSNQTDNVTQDHERWDATMNALVDMSNVVYMGIHNATLAVQVDGVFYIPDNESFSQDIGEVMCGIARQFISGYCVNCPPGTFYKEQECIDCKRGAYQENEAQLSCDKCPTHWTTAVEGATSIYNCTVKDTKETETNEENDTELGLAVGVPVAIVAFLSLTAVILVYKTKCVHTTTTATTEEIKLQRDNVGKQASGPASVTDNEENVTRNFSHERPATATGVDVGLNEPYYVNCSKTSDDYESNTGRSNDKSQYMTLNHTSNTSKDQATKHLEDNDDQYSNDDYLNPHPMTTVN